MKKENQENGIGRRRFLKRTALAGAAFCMAPAFEKVTAAERVITGKVRQKRQPFTSSVHWVAAMQPSVCRLWDSAAWD